MKLERSKAWWLNRARREGDAVIGAGLLAIDPAPADSTEVAAADTAGKDKSA